MKLIITRPRQDAEPLARKLTAMGITVECLPLLEIVPRGNTAIPPGTWQAIIFTSANAVRCLPEVASIRACPVYVVGPQSAAAARDRGFEHVESLGGDMMRLAAALRGILKPEAGPVLYVSGSITSGDFAKQLAGFAVTHLIVYDAVATSPDGVARSADSADVVLLYSPRSADLWCQAKGANPRIMHYCLSANVAARLPVQAQRKVAPSPDDAGMLTLLESGTEAA